MELGWSTLDLRLLRDERFHGEREKKMIPACNMKLMPLRSSHDQDISSIASYFEMDER